jgi:two-component system NtrC family sensor kinase
MSTATSDLTRFGLTEMLRCSRALHRAARDAPTMETCGRRICRTLYEHLRVPNGDRACALVRCYKTHPFGSLPPELRRFARRACDSTQEPEASMKCLTLLGSAGSEPQWNSRFSSKGHQAIPLPSTRIVE